MTQTKWINVNGNLYEGTIETVQNWDGSQDTVNAIATFSLGEMTIRSIVPYIFIFDLDGAISMCQKEIERHQWKIDTLPVFTEHSKKEVDYLQNELKKWQSKLDLLKHES